MFYKLTNYECEHNNFIFRKGLNIDTEPYGIFFTNAENISRWILYSNKKMYYIWDVTIPPGEKVETDVCSYKAHRIILKNKRCIYKDEDLFCRILQESGEWVARDVPDEYITPKIYNLLKKLDPYFDMYLSPNVVKKYNSQ